MSQAKPEPPVDQPTLSVHFALGVALISVKLAGPGKLGYIALYNTFC